MYCAIATNSPIDYAICYSLSLSEGNYKMPEEKLTRIHWIGQFFHEVRESYGQNDDRKSD